MSILRVSVAAAGAALAAAWGALGHMLVAQIARDVMQPETRDAVDAIIALLADTYTASPDFVTAACWADDLKVRAARRARDATRARAALRSAWRFQSSGSAAHTRAVRRTAGPRGAHRGPPALH